MLNHELESSIRDKIARDGPNCFIDFLNSCVDQDIEGLSKTENVALRIAFSETREVFEQNSNQ